MDADQNILESWSNSKFIIIDWLDKDDDLLNTSGNNKLVVLTDFSFWTERIEELDNWCLDNGCRRKGMTVEFDTDDQLLMFCLRWT